MDALYYIGGGSMRHNIELRLSLRSLEKYVKNIDRVFIVGNKPEFLTNVEYLWVDDDFKFWKNAFIKTKAAIKAGISDDFLLMNDDFFITGEIDAKTYPYYHKGEMPAQGISEYTDVIANTRKVLEREGKTTFHYGVHCPIRINGAKYLTLEKYYDEPVSARCLYGNLFCDGQEIKDNKGDKFETTEVKCWSSKQWLNDECLAELKKIYETPSKYEKDD